VRPPGTPPPPRRRASGPRRVLVATLLTLAAAPLAAAEGMWPPDRFPFERFEREWGYRADPAVLERIRLGSLRVASGGGSGAFVSRDGLVLTNQHVVAGCLRDLSTAERDLVREGFLAASRADELLCPAFEVHVLAETLDVTARVRGALAAGAPAAETAAAIRAATAAIEQECAAAAGAATGADGAASRRCEVVSLYQGAEFDLYRYDRYTDVRVVFAPERRIATFGGDVDNFEYPRYAFDVAFLRVYRDGRPLEPARHFRLSRRGPQEGDALLVAGHPAGSARRTTVAQLEWLRDVAYPHQLANLGHLRSRLVDYAARGPAAERAAALDIEWIDNSIKVYSGYLSGLLDPALVARRRADEAKLRAAVAADPALAAETGDPWGELAAAYDVYREFHARAQAVDKGLGGMAGMLAWYARALVRLADERERPNGERLREFREATLPSLLAELEAATPIDRDYEALRLGHALREAARQLGPLDPIVRALFADSTPEEVAAAAVAGTRLDDPAFRGALASGGRDAIAATDDPLIRLTLVWEKEARALRERAEREVEAVERSAGMRLADAHAAVAGRGAPPDATWSLRVSWGSLRGYEDGGRRLDPSTRWAGLFARAGDKGGRPPFDLPASFAAARSRLDLGTPLDFVVDADILGGSSGSPVVDRRGELVGVVFDGNVWMLPNRFVYTDAKARAIAVDARAILEALDVVYGAKALVRELAAAPGR
jgi:hypothetical protein